MLQPTTADMALLDSELGIECNLFFPIACSAFPPPCANKPLENVQCLDEDSDESSRGYLAGETLVVGG